MASFFYNTDDGDARKLISRGFAVTGGPRKFGKQLDQLRPLDQVLMYENGTGVVAIGRVREEWDRKSHADTWYYESDSHEYRIRVKWLADLTKNPISVTTLKEVLGYQPRWAVRKIVKRQVEIGQLVNKHLARKMPSAEESCIEGEMRSSLSSVRNAKLREAAKKKYGLRCYCCEFDYEAFYGPVGRGLAIVHHLKTFKKIGNKPRTATVRDVRVVCANCHHTIHVEDPPIPLDHLKAQIAEFGSR